MMFAVLAICLLLAYAAHEMAAMQRAAPRPENYRQYINGAVIRTGHLARVLAARRALGIGEAVQEERRPA